MSHDVLEQLHLDGAEVAHLAGVLQMRPLRSHDLVLAEVVDAVEDALAARFTAIAELHAPLECSNVRCPGGGLHCRSCDEGLAADGQAVHWPCPTMRALGATPLQPAAAAPAGPPGQSTPARPRPA